MRVLVTFAVQAEFAPWRNRWRFKSAPFRTPHYSSARSYTAQIHGVEVEVFLTGIGLREAEPGLSLLISHSPDCCISTGLAGGLQPSLKIGDIAVARSVAAFSGESKRLCDSKLVEIARQNGATAVSLFLTSEHLVGRSQEKQAAAARGDVVEMESLEVLTKAAGNWIPSVAIRSISDAVDEDLPIDFGQTITRRGKISLARVLAQVAGNPRQLPALMAFGKRSHMAAVSLADFLDRYIPAVRLTFAEPPAITAGVAAR